MGERAVVYASRFGTTARHAEVLAESWGARTVPIVTGDESLPEAEQLVVLSAIIWDRPLPAMRRWLARHGAALRGRVVACAVVCGSAGVREGGGLSYARRLGRRLGLSPEACFALVGRVPERERLRGWEWWALRLFARLMRKPQLFTIEPDFAATRALAERLPR